MTAEIPIYGAGKIRALLDLASRRNARAENSAPPFYHNEFPEVKE